MSHLIVNGSDGCEDMGSSSKLKVVLDSNFLMIPFQFGIDILAELDRILDRKYEIFVTRGVMQELEKLSRSKGARAKEAQGALSLIKALHVLNSKGKSVDDVLVDMASKDTIICTNDRILKEKIKKKGAPVIYLRQKSHLVIEGYVR
jgi:hypothetical protein